jgi:hypothetical protein
MRQKGVIPMRGQVAFQIVLTGMLLVPATTATASKTPAEQTHGQIVRLSLVQGDVRIARDQQQGQAKNADWEKAISGLPLESGFSLATGSGRAVIELQDASTLYLGENSVLVLSDLTTTGDVPHTEVALLSGTVSVYMHPVIAGEQFILRAPTDTMTLQYPNQNDIRVTAYMDAIALTALTDGTAMPGKTADVAPVGQTFYYRAAKPVTVADKGDEAAMAEWDKWVADKNAQRVAAYASVMQESGMKKPVPGLDSLAGKGKFVDCGEYGKCWEPPQPTAEELKAAAQAQANAPANTQANGAAAESALTASETEPDSGSTGSSSTQPTVIRKTSLAPGGGPQTGADSMLAFDSYFPCGPDSYYYRMMMYNYGGVMPMAPYGGMMPMGAYGGMAYAGMYDPLMWNWAVCHTGSWLFQNNRYLWVPGSGGQMNYQPPVLWVKSGGRQGFVPIHPRDVAGQTPVNLQNGMISARGKNSQSEVPIKIDNGASVKLMSSPPHEYRDGYSISLARSDSPRITGHIAGAEGGQKALLPGNARSVAISFDHESQSFMVSRTVGSGNSIKTENEPVGSFLVRSGGAAFGGPVSDHAGFANGPRGGSSAVMNGGRSGDFRGSAAFSGGAPRGGGGGAEARSYGGGPQAGGAVPAVSGSGGAASGGGHPSGGSFGGGSGGGGGHSSAAPAPSH